MTTIRESRCKEATLQLAWVARRICFTFLDCAGRQRGTRRELYVLACAIKEKPRRVDGACSLLSSMILTRGE